MRRPLVICVILLAGCNMDVSEKNLSATDSALVSTPADSASINLGAVRDTVMPADLQLTVTGIQTGAVGPEELVRFAETLVGTPYVYGSSDPRKGFDCSGFISYVFSHFNINVPRSSIDFTHVGSTVDVTEARTGDLILFTGTGAFDTDIGHMGLVVSNEEGALHFIHSTSGRAMGVTITPLNEQYRKRFVRVSRIF